MHGANCASFSETKGPLALESTLCSPAISLPAIRSSVLAGTATFICLAAAATSRMRSPCFMPKPDLRLHQVCPRGDWPPPALGCASASPALPRNLPATAAIPAVFKSVLRVGAMCPPGGRRDQTQIGAQKSRGAPSDLTNWRRRQDSNLRALSGQRFSRPPPSATRPLLKRRGAGYPSEPFGSMGNNGGRFTSPQVVPP